MCRLISPENTEPCSHPQCTCSKVGFVPHPTSNSSHILFNSHDLTTLKKLKTQEDSEPSPAPSTVSFSQQILSYQPRARETPSSMAMSALRGPMPPPMGTPLLPSVFTLQTPEQVTVANCYNLLLSQNKMLLEMKEKTDKLEQISNFLVSEVSSLKTGLNVRNQQAGPGAPSQTSPITSDPATSDILLNSICPGKSNQNFLYRLEVSADFPNLVYRERYFRLEIRLVDLRTGQLATNLNKIPISLCLYSSENPPKQIILNTSGNKAIKGMADIDLIAGQAVFDKVQINEVSSHFLNGWIFMAIVPKYTPQGADSMAFMANYSGGSDLYIDPRKVKPLILDKIIVKAKKIKNF